MSEFEAPSGAKVKINIAPFKDSMKLKSAIAKELADSDFSFDFDPSKDIKKQDFDIAGIAKIMALLDSSEAVNNALMDCLLRCTYNSEKITGATFEPEEAREDYYDIVAACLKVNIGPFFKSLLSKFLPIIKMFQENLAAKQAEKSQKSE